MIPVGHLARKARVPWGLAGFLAVLAVVEPAVERHRLSFETRTYLTWRTGRDSAMAESAGAEVLCFGDSLIKRGLIAPVIEETSGLSVRNLAVIGGQAPSSYFLLRKALDAGAKPRVVVVDFHPSILSARPRANEPYWPLLADFREALDLARNARDGHLLATVMLAKILPSIRYRDGVREALADILRGGPPRRFPENQASLRNIERNGGSLVPPSGPTFGGEIAYLERATDLTSWKCSAANSGYVERFLDLADERGIAVVWLIPPFSPAWTARLAEAGHEAAYERFVRELQRRHPGLIVLDGRHSRYENGVFLDATHLARPGAVTLSADLGTVLRGLSSSPPGTRWFPLARYREVVTRSRLEDTHQSRMAIADQGVERR